MSWPSPTTSCSDVSGANGSAGLTDLPASASGAMLAFRLQRAAGEIAIEEAVLVRGRLAFGLLEDLFVHRRQRAGRIGIAGVAGQRKGLAAAAAEIHFPEFAALAWLGHPTGAAIAVEGFGVLPDPGDRTIGAYGFEFEPGDALRGVAGQDLARRRNVEELPAPAAHAFLRPQRVIIRNHIIDRESALQPHGGFLDGPAGL